MTESDQPATQVQMAGENRSDGMVVASDVPEMDLPIEDTYYVSTLTALSAVPIEDTHYVPTLTALSAVPIEDTHYVPTLTALSAVVLLQNIGRAVNVCRCPCGRLQQMDFVPCNNLQVWRSTKCSGGDCVQEMTQLVLSLTSDITEVFEILSANVIAYLSSWLDTPNIKPLHEIVPKAINVFTVICQGLLKVLNGQIYQSILDQEIFHELEQLAMSAIRIFNYMTLHLKFICPDTYTRATTDIIIMGRHLAQKRLRDALPIPVWPLFEIKDLLPYSDHHEALCERYLAIGRTQDAWLMVWELVMMDLNMVSEPIIRVFTCILLNHEAIFSDANCQQHLDEMMGELHNLPALDDILALGTLLCWETHCTVFNTEKKWSIETLIRKATMLLEIWSCWFHSVGSKLLSEEGHPRADISLRFLRKYSELAIANFENFAATRSLCAAYKLAHKMRKWDVIVDLTVMIVTLTPQLGLHIHCENTDIFMDSVGLGEDSGLLGLVAIASHHLHTGQLQNFLHLRDAFYIQLPIHARNVVIDYSQAVMQRLEAEFLMLPDSRVLAEKNALSKPFPNPVCLAMSSVELLWNICAKKAKFYFPKDISQYNILGPWQMVHEYLCSLKILGELLSHTGDVQGGQTYLLRGVRIAEKMQLASWATIFHSKLIEYALAYDDLQEATKRLQDALTFIKCNMSTTKSCLQHEHRKPTVIVVPKERLGHGFGEFNQDWDHNSCPCGEKSDLRQDIISELLEAPEVTNDTVDKKPQYLIVTDINGCCNCCQSHVVASCINIMHFQAEILWRQKKPICLVSSFLQCSLTMADKFAATPPCTNITELFANTRLKVSFLSRDIRSSTKVLAESAYRCAEIYIQNIYLRSDNTKMLCGHGYPDITYILVLLDYAEGAGRKAGGFHMSNVTVASALLLKCSLSYQSVLKRLYSEDEQDGETGPSDLPRALHIVKCSLNYQSVLKTLNGEDEQDMETGPSEPPLAFAIIRLTLGLLSKDAQRVNTQSNNSTLTMQENEQQSHTNLSGHSITEPVTAEQKAPCSDSISDVPDLISFSDKSENYLWLNKLIENFPSLAAAQNARQRKIILQSALQEIREVPHYWFYRQISQSLAMCLWEQQLSEAWGTKQACSLQLEIAAHLMDSMHVTFQHKMSLQFCFNLCDHFLRVVGPVEELNKQAIEEAMRELKFGGDVIQNFKHRVASLPTDWTVVQITIANYDPSNPGKGQIFVTRICQGQEPLTVGLPRERNEFLENAKEACEMVDGSFSSSYYGNLQPMPEILQYLQDVFLAGHKWLLRGQLDCVRQKSVQDCLDEAGWRAVHAVLEQHEYVICYTELRSLLEVILEATKEDILSLLECMWPPHVAETLAQICLNIHKEVAKLCEGQEQERRGPVVLILDNVLIHYPWESMPDLIGDTVTRMPSLANLTAHLTLHTKTSRSPFKDGIDKPNVAINVASSHSPSTWDLTLELKRYRGWRVCTQDIDADYKLFAKLFRKSSLYLYFGDSWSQSRFNEYTCGKTFALIIGQRTGSMTTGWKLDAKGTPLSLLIGGCSAVMGNLWRSRAEDFSRTISCLFDAWMSPNQPASISELMEAARQACGSSDLVRLGLVIYGLPVKMN